jgi:hypothetical protein
MVVNDFGARCAIHRDRIDGTHRHAPGLGTLGTGVRNEQARLTEFKDLDPRFNRIENALGLETAGHFALQAARTLLGVHKKNFFHASRPSLVCPLIFAAGLAKPYHPGDLPLNPFF